MIGSKRGYKMIKIIIEDTMFRVVPESQVQMQLIRSVMNNIASYKAKSWQFKRKALLKKFKSNAFLTQKWSEWNGSELLYTEKFGDFITHNGFIKPLIRVLVLFKQEYEIEDLREEPKQFPYPIQHTSLDLYDWQRDMFNKVVNGDGVGIISSPTGSGKTFIGTELVTHYNVPTIVIADKITMRKTNIKFKKRGSAFVGYYVSEGHDDIPFIAVCTSILLRNYYLRKGKQHDDFATVVDGCNLLIYDEVHRAGADTSVLVLENCLARYRIGMSGTALMRSDGKDMEYTSRIGQVIAGIDKESLLEKQAIVPIEVLFKPVRRIANSRMKYAESEMKNIIFNNDRNSKILDAILDFTDKNMKFLIFIDKILHAQEISAMSGIGWTDSKDKDKNDKFRQLRNGDINGLICTYDLAGVGFDLPSLDGLIFGGAGKSAIKFVQAKGRVIRIFKGKSKGIIIDFADSSKYFDDHAYARYKVYQSEMGVTVKAKGTWLHGK